jgi:hypothetical protein
MTNHRRFQTALRLISLINLIPFASSQTLPISDCGASAISIVSLNYVPGPQANSSEQQPPYWGEALQISVPENSKLREPTWHFDGPAIHDFDERVSTAEGKAVGWQTRAALSPIRQHATFRLYFLPIRPPDAPMSTRTITLDAIVDGSNSPCQSKRVIQLNPHPRPAELYTADHRDPFQANPHQGRVIDTHFQWHFFHSLGRTDFLTHPSFLHWHHLFVDRYTRWRTLFGYPDLTPLWPARDSPFLLSSQRYWLFTKDPIPPATPSLAVPAHTTLNYSGATEQQFAQFESEVITRHNQVHQRLQTCPLIPVPFGCFRVNSSPKSELFWSFHLYLDNLYTTLCPSDSPTPPAGCPTTGFY